MEYKKLGNTAIKVSPFVMGCWSVGGDYFGSIEDTNSIRCIKTYRNMESILLILQKFMEWEERRKCWEKH